MDGRPVKKLLVLDDDRIVADTLGMILTDKRYEVRVVYSAESAIELVAGWVPDVAIVDVLLPGMNGVEFGILMETACPDCRVLLFTALGGLIEPVERARARGHLFEVLEKPIPPVFMLNRVADLIASSPKPRRKVEAS